MELALMEFIITQLHKILRETETTINIEYRNMQEKSKIITAVEIRCKP